MFFLLFPLLGAIVRLMQMQDDVIGPVNIGNPSEFRVIDLAKEVIRITGASSSIVYRDLPSDDPKQRRPDISLAKTLLHWEPEIALEQGLANTAAYFRKYLKIIFPREQALFGDF